MSYALLKKAFLTVMELPQLTVVFEPLRAEQDLFLWFFATYFGDICIICLDEDPNKALRSIFALKLPKDTYTKVVIIKCLFSFSKFLTNNHKLAFKGFNWALKFNSISKRINADEEQSIERLAEGSEMCIALLSARSYLKCDDSSITIDGLSQRIYEILNASGYLDISKETHRHKLDYYFTTLGTLFQRRAVLKAYIISDTHVQLDETDLEEMIRNLILVTNMTPRDDGLLTKIFDELLIALLLYGNLHVKVIWVFKFLRDFLTLESHLHNCPFTRDYFSEYSSFNEIKNDLKPILKDIMNLKNQFKDDDFDFEVIDNNSTSAFLIPKFKVIIERNDLISASSLGDDDNKVFSQEVIKSLIDKSNEFIKLWVDSYKDYQGQLPEPVYKYLEKLLFI